MVLHCSSAFVYNIELYFTRIITSLQIKCKAWLYFTNMISNHAWILPQLFSLQLYLSKKFIQCILYNGTKISVSLILMPHPLLFQISIKHIGHSQDYMLSDFIGNWNIFNTEECMHNMTAHGSKMIKTIKVQQKNWQKKIKVCLWNTTVCPQHQQSPTRHVFVKHGCPRRQQSPNMAKSLSPKFWPHLTLRGMWCQWGVSNP